ncbi:acyl-CoA Delta-9 desaturase-like isoform X3 [Chironomus tepperi]|uniref:acyl-CoA Delta-9 desaturase-like isoform X3 n=1 Tax=Chironomus tepperi TaxID=113505 RepID=UPI00391F12AF
MNAYDSHLASMNNLCRSAYVLYIASGLGITAGAHRLWTHRTFEAKWPLKLMLVIFNTIAFQNSLFHWCRDHRIHHKFSDTDADPHNATRGFFFSHCGWLMIKKHPHVIAAGKRVDLSDLENDSFVMFQKNHGLWMFVLFCFILPTYIPYYFWNESLWNSWLIPTCLRYAAVLNITWCVNSLAHIWGHKPYDKSILASQNVFVSIIALGEGWHNYHHVFPWDYKVMNLYKGCHKSVIIMSLISQTAELGNYRLNLTTMFIDFMAKIGWAYDLKTVNKEIVDKRKKRTGDSTQTNIWGWADPDQSKSDKNMAKIIFKNYN